MGRGTMHQDALVADPDETLPRPVFPGEGQSVRVPELPNEEQGFAHRRVELRLSGCMRRRGCSSWYDSTYLRTRGDAWSREASNVEKCRNLKSCQICR